MAAPSWWDTMLAAVRGQETQGNYAEDAPGCLGAYCWENMATWANMADAAGYGHVANQNPATLPPKVQDAVASINMGRIYDQTHSVTAVLEWWNGGQTHSVPNPGLPAQRWAPTCGGGSSGAYACQVETRMKLGGHYLAGGGSGTTSFPSGSGSGGVVAVSASADCLLGFGGIPGTAWISDFFGGGGNLGQICVLTRSEARAVLSVGIMAAGAMVALPGLFIIVIAMGMPMTGPAGDAAEKVGAMTALVPGLEGAGVAIAAGGGALKSSAKQTQKRRQGPPRDEPRENPDLEVRGGTVRESAQQRQARQRRQQAAARSRARRSAGSGKPAPSSETGF